MSALFAVWSYEHDGWWGANRRGYFRHWTSAGAYSKADAEQICDTRGQSGSEVAVPYAHAPYWTPGGWGTPGTVHRPTMESALVSPAGRAPSDEEVAREMAYDLYRAAGGRASAETFYLNPQWPEHSDASSYVAYVRAAQQRLESRCVSPKGDEG